MNIIEAMNYLAEHPNGNASVFRLSWNKHPYKSFVYLVGDVKTYDPKSIIKPECYKVTIADSVTMRGSERPYEADFCDICQRLGDTPESEMRSNQCRGCEFRMDKPSTTIKDSWSKYRLWCSLGPIPDRNSGPVSESEQWKRRCPHCLNE